MFNVIYLVSGGRPSGTTDILVTQAYRWAFERGQNVGKAAAYATIIFVILVVWTLAAGRLTRSKADA
jgi:arabinogalactan oligomer/maltooligosaccharide transport system permease protein